MTLRGFLEEMMRRGASDLHLAGGATPRVRVHGLLVELDAYGPLESEHVQRLTREARDHVATGRPAAGPVEGLGAGPASRPVDGLGAEPATSPAAGPVDLAIEVSGLGRFRLHLSGQRGMPSLAVRHVPARLPALGDLDLPPVVMRWTELRRGLVLVTGPTGSGKSTTLAALIGAMNQRRQAHVVTIEDPIEFVHPQGRCLIQQREVGWDVPSFAAALKGVLRQDPDAVLIGELRDLETMAAALSVAETGHLVLATAHTRSAAETVHRFIGAFPSERQPQVRAQFAAVLEGVVAQLLLPRADGQGRVVAAETLVATSAVRSVIRDDRAHQLPALIQTGRDQGMQTLSESLQRHYLRGTIRRDTALAYAPDRLAFLRSVGEYDPTRPVE